MNQAASTAYRPLCAKDYQPGDPAFLWWNLPLTVAPEAAHECGQLMATDFIKYLREAGRNEFAPHHLAFVINGMAFNLMKALGYTWEGAAPADIPLEVYSVSAQIGGFCKVLAEWAQAAATKQGASLDGVLQTDIAAELTALIGTSVSAPTGGAA